MQERTAYNVSLIQRDMTLKGWLAIDLARRAGISHMTVGRFLSGEHQTARMAKKIAKALGQEIGRYLLATEERVSA